MERTPCILLQPLGQLHRQWVLSRLANDLEAAFGRVCRVTEDVVAPEPALNLHRGQYSAPELLSSLRKVGAGQECIVLGVAEVDLYAEGLNFVFGQAEMPGQFAVISLFRLRKDAGDERDELLYTRALKEAVHEVGHTLGLGHCPNAACVMHFSRTLDDTDLKGTAPCPNCAAKAPASASRK